jgi:hypothetical protein
MNTQPIEIKNETSNPLHLVGPVGPVGAASKAALERRLAEIQAVQDDDLAHATVDVHTAVSIVVGALPAIRALREAMGALPGFKAALADGLEDYAWATSEANSRYEHALAPGEDLAPLLEEAMTMRETLRLDAVSLAHRGFIEKERLTAFKGLTGFKNVAFELMDWALVMRECWSKVQGKSGLTAEEVDAASKLGERLLAAASIKEQQPERIAEAAHLRQQALRLLLDAYDEVRRALTFLRWQEDDVDTIAPSLFFKNGRRGKQDGAAGANGGTTPPAEPAEPVVTEPVATPPPAAAPTPAPGMPGAKMLID